MHDRSNVRRQLWESVRSLVATYEVPETSVYGGRSEGECRRILGIL
jgi:hypothetical protein